MADDEQLRRIGNLTAIVMLLLAFVVDALQILFGFLTVVAGIGIMFSLLLTFVAGAGFALWFALSNVSYASGKKAVAKFLTTLSSMAIELTGLLSLLPMMTVNVAVIIVLSRMEDAETARELHAAADAERKAANDNEWEADRAEKERQATETAAEDEEERQAA